MYLPKISIITPSYNQGQFLEETIQSVLNQNYPEIEYIIIDGGSTDNSVEIIKKYEDRLAYWVSEKDRGQTHAINKGFKKATGEIVNWLNSDDVLLPGAISNIVHYFTSNPMVDFAYGDYVLVDFFGKEIVPRREIDFDLNILLYSGCFIQQSTCFFRKSVIDKIGLLDEEQNFYMDYEFYLRAAQNGFTFHNIRKSLVAFRCHASSKSVSRDIRTKERRIEIQNRYRTTRFNRGSIIDKFCFLLLRKAYKLKKYLTLLLQRGEIRILSNPMRFRMARERHSKPDEVIEYQTPNEDSLGR